MPDPQPGLEPPDDIPAVSAEDLVDGEPVDGEPQARRYPSTIGGMFYLVVLVVTAVGFGLAAAGHWRTGVRVIGGALVAAAGIRLALRPRDAGMLAVRHKVVDAGLLVLLGVSLIVLAGDIPDQPA